MNSLPKYYVPAILILLVFYCSPSLANNVSFFVKQPKEMAVGETYQVNISINKQSISGVSKFEIDLPEGFDIQVVNASGANFYIENHMAKFIWMNLPESESINLSYLISAKNISSVKNKINSTFHYTEDMEKHSSSFISFIDVIGQNTVLSLKSIDKLIKENAISDFLFKVQVGAYQEKLSPEQIKEKYGSNEVQVEKDAGYYKYTIGPFKDYDSALEYRDACQINGAFLVLYFVDLRLSTEDAYKMISN